MKQVWILNHYAHGPDEAGGARHFYLAKHLLDCGWKTTLIAASVEHGSGVQRLGDHENDRCEKIEGVSFLWVKTPGYHGNSGRRMLNMLAYSVRVLLKRTTKDVPRPDVVIGSSVHPFAAASGVLLARRYRVPFIFEVRDLWPQTLVDMGRLKEGAFLTRVLRMLERWLYRRAIRIIVLLPRASDYIVPLGIEKDRVVWIPNGVELALFPHTMEDHPEPSKTFTLMYLGAHGQANDLENMIKAMAFIKNDMNHKRIELRLIGDGPQKAELMQMTRNMGLDNVHFEPPIPKVEVPAVAAQADAFVISVRDLPELYKFGISMNKLFDYLAAAKPIVIASAAVNNPVAEAGAGVTVLPDCPEKMAGGIIELVDMTEAKRQAMGRAGRKYVEENHSFEKLARRLSDVLDDSLALYNQK